MDYTYLTCGKVAPLAEYLRKIRTKRMVQTVSIMKHSFTCYDNRNFGWYVVLGLKFVVWFVSDLPAWNTSTNSFSG